MRLIIATILCIFVHLENGYTQATKKSISAKELVGIWQVNTPTVGDALQKCFRFYKNEKFVLDYSQYDDIGRIRRVEGQYKLTDSTLYLTINSRTELVDGKLIQGSIGFQKEEFVLDSTRIIKITQINEQPNGFNLKVCNPKNDAKCIQINNAKYYKLSSDPDKYNK